MDTGTFEVDESEQVNWNLLPVKRYIESYKLPRPRTMPPVISWSPILPGNHPSSTPVPSQPVSHAHKLQMANGLLQAYRSVHSQGRLPTLEELDRTRFVRIPNEAKAAIVFLDANPPHKETGYCLLQADKSADMDKVENSDKAYRAAFGVTGIEDLPQEVWDKVSAYVPGKNLVDLACTSKISRDRVYAELEKKQKTSQLVHRLQGLQKIPLKDVVEIEVEGEAKTKNALIFEFQAIVDKALDDSPVKPDGAPVKLHAEHIAEVVRAALYKPEDSLSLIHEVRDSDRPRGAQAAFEGMARLIENISAADQVKALKDDVFQTGLRPGWLPDIEYEMTAHLHLGSIVAKINNQNLKADGIIALISLAPRPQKITPFASVVRGLINLAGSIAERKCQSELAQKISDRFIGHFIYSYELATEEEKPILKEVGEELISLLDENEIESLNSLGEPLNIPWRNKS